MGLCIKIIFRKMAAVMVSICLLIGVGFANGTADAYQFCYDSNGNLLGITKNGILTTEYHYNDLNQLALYIDLERVASYYYRYYANGQRAQKTKLSTGEQIAFYYGQQGKLLNEVLFLTGAKTKISSYFAADRFIRDIGKQNDSTMQASLAVRRNNPVSIDSSNHVDNRKSIHLDDYGLLGNANTIMAVSKPIHSENKRLNHFNIDCNPFIYGTGYYDNESGLNFQQARYYNSVLQRFMAQDNRNLMNRYNYANANPVMNYDPSGHNAVSDAFHKSASLLGGRGAIYGLNGAVMITSIVSMGTMLLFPATAISALAFGAEGISVLAGGSAILTQASADINIFGSQTNQQLSMLAAAMGLVDLPVSVLVGGGAVAYGVRDRAMSLSLRGGASFTERTNQAVEIFKKYPIEAMQDWLSISVERAKYTLSSWSSPRYNVIESSGSIRTVVIHDDSLIYLFRRKQALRRRLDLRDKEVVEGIKKVASKIGLSGEVGSAQFTKNYPVYIDSKVARKAGQASNDEIDHMFASNSAFSSNNRIPAVDEYTLELRLGNREV